MLVIAVCVTVVAAGVVIVVRSGASASPRLPELAAGALLRYLGVALAAGVAAGLIAAGAGGRLVMRLLALTSPDAEGSLTEASELVGEITAGGTAGFVLFTGVAAGLLSGVLYALVRPLLPPGRLGGAILGLLLLVLAGTRLEPLRSENFDFAIVGPPWLAVLAFAAVALLQGMLVVAFAARLSERGLVAAGGRPVRWGRIALAVVALAALPGFVGAVNDILSAA
jgi:hypothetical protein